MRIIDLPEGTSADEDSLAIDGGEGTRTVSKEEFLGDVKASLNNRVRVDTASQGLTDTQKSNARTNIGVGNVGTLSYTVVSTWT